MGTVTKGILDIFNGTVGTVVGSTWKGKPVLRSRPRKRKGEPSPAQLVQQARFSLMVDFLHPVLPLLEESFTGNGMSGYNKAVSLNMDAITGDYPQLAIDYSKVLISKGSLPNAAAPSAASPSAGKLVFTWVDNSTTLLASATDRVIAAVYDASLKHWVASVNEAARNSGTLSLDVGGFSGRPVQTWFSFVSESGRYARSIFTGQVNIL